MTGCERNFNEAEEDMALLAVASMALGLNLQKLTAAINRATQVHRLACFFRSEAPRGFASVYCNY
ncbi:hypothetical protein C1H46_018136 [Malus baccata]|uniref:Uncharacterized protein n=1 Tax=Malus baccata TaxID=106549 RepID=A0A540MBV5_MALBA|nr:hypothetical protein C1H46_018136 [Malus baccata]